MPVSGFIPSILRTTLLGGLCAMLAGPAQADPSRPCAPMPVAGQDVSGPPEQPARVFTIASLNLAGQAQIGDVVAAWVQKRGIDILLLQEVGDSSMDGQSVVSALGDRLMFHSLYAPAYVAGGTHTQGLAIVSRYPLESARAVSLPYHHLRFRSRCRIALAATMVLPDGPVHLVNVHLDTRINSEERIAQLAPVLDVLGGMDAPQLIGGDFNTMNIRWFRTMWPFFFLQRQTKAVAASLGAGGFHTPFSNTPPTHDFPLLRFRLDWLYLKHLRPIDWSVDSLRLTDHKGVWARMTPDSGLAPSQP